MATSAVTVTVNPFPTGYDNTINTITIRGKLTIAAGDYPATGIPVAFNIKDASAVGNPICPVKLESPSSGFVYRWDMVNTSIRIWLTGTAANDPLNEVSTTTPSGVVSDTIYFSAVFSRS